MALALAVRVCDATGVTLAGQATRSSGFERLQPATLSVAF
jgi:hypothetical protein